MAYEIQLYCTSGGMTAGKGFGALLSRVSADGTELLVSDRRSGEGWAAARLDPAATPGAGGCHVQFDAGSPTADAMIAEAAPGDPSGRVAAADAVVTLTLSGDVRWAVVSAVWHAATALWDVIPFDDGSGFAVELEGTLR
jgi:hypothetical protein